MKIFLIVIFFIERLSASPIGINGKLGFEDASLKSDYKVVNINPGSSSSVKYKTIKSNDDLDSIGIVCVSGAGCNTTKTNNGNKNANGTIQTDIVVHVETKVDLKDNNKFNSNSKSTTNAPIGDLPDVPVVVGYKGTELDRTTSDPSSRSFNPSPPIVISDLDPLLSTTKYMKPSSFSFQSSVQSRIDSSAANDFFYPPSTLSATSPIDSKVNININAPPSASVALSANNNDKNYKYGYNSNGIELRTAYLQPSSFSNHYFSENIPHQYLFYPKKPSSSSLFNPVEFKHQSAGAGHKSLWNYAYYPYNFEQNNYNHRHTSTTVCSCKVGKGINTTPPPLPGTAAWHRQNNGYGNSVRRNFNNPGSQINDKLAPPFSQ